MSKNARVYTAEATLGCHHRFQANYKPEINDRFHIFNYPEATWPQGDTFHPHICKNKAHNNSTLRVHLCHKSIRFLIKSVQTNCSVTLEVLTVKRVFLTVHKRCCSIVYIYIKINSVPGVQLCAIALLTLCGGGPEAGRQTQHQTPKQGQAAPFHSRPHSWRSTNPPSPCK